MTVISVKPYSLQSIRNQNKLTMKEPVIRNSEDYIPFSTIKLLAVCIALICLAETYFPQAYGKLAEGAYFTVPSRVGWWLMELPVSVVFGYLFWIRGQENSKLLVPRILGCIFTGHYLCK